MVHIFRLLQISKNITKLKNISDGLIKNFKYESNLGKDTQTLLQNAVVKVPNTTKILRTNFSFHNEEFKKLMEDKSEKEKKKTNILSVYQSQIVTQNKDNILKNNFSFTNEEIRNELQNMMEKTKEHKVNPKTLRIQQDRLLKFLNRAVNEIIQDKNMEKKYETVKVQFALLINKSLDKINLILQSPHTSKIVLIVLLEQLCAYIFNYDVKLAEEHAGYIENFVRRCLTYYSSNVIVLLLLKMTKFFIELYISETKEKETKKKLSRRKNNKIYRGDRSKIS